MKRSRNDFAWQQSWERKASPSATPTCRRLLRGITNAQPLDSPPSDKPSFCLCHHPEA